MRFEHPDLPGRRVHLAYCMNLHAADDLAGVLAGMRKITLPLRDSLVSPAHLFGVGLYFPAPIARQLVSAEGQADYARLERFLREERLDPFTFNAFPFGDFHRPGLKRGVFSPAWGDPQRLEYTLQVAQIAERLNPGRPGYVSISTHPGCFGPWAAGQYELALAQFGQWVDECARIEREGGPRLRLALEAEPRAVAGDTQALGAQLEDLLERLAPRHGATHVQAHLGACLDTCHAAVEFEECQASLERATVLPLGKLQVSSAIVLRDPGQRPRARAALLALDEPRYLHQTTGRRGQELLRLDDLPDLQAACADPASPWLECDEWRTHFHVPIDLGQLGDSGLETTRAQGLQSLAALCEQPDHWGCDELHVEIETYTWSILPRAAHGELDLVDGLEREYRCVLEVLAERGWQLAAAPD